jgi:hypothetical protein
MAGFGTVCGLAAACGGDADEPDAPKAMAGSAGVPVAGTASGGSGGSASGTGGATTGGSSSRGGSAALCEGTFGASQTLFDFEKNIASSLSITSDELELFFVDVRSDPVSHNISVLKRSSKSAAFSGPTVVSELQAACAAEDYPALDVSDDGLRIYFTCLDGPAPLRFATRASRSAAWVVDAEPIGTVGDSITVSGDELTAVGVRDLGSDPRPEAHTRATPEGSFGAALAVAGVAESFRNPDLSFDGRMLFGVVDQSGADARIAFVSLDGALGATAAPSTAGMPQAPAGSTASSVSDYTPTLTPDCRSIYFFRGTVPSTGGIRYTLEYAER